MTLLAATGPATLDDVRAWLTARGLRLDGRKILVEWRPRPKSWLPGDHALYTGTGSIVASYYQRDEDDDAHRWSWVVRGINSFGQRAATEADARAAVEERLLARGWRWAKME